MRQAHSELAAAFDITSVAHVYCSYSLLMLKWQTSSVTIANAMVLGTFGWSCIMVARDTCSLMPISSHAVLEDITCQITAWLLHLKSSNTCFLLSRVIQSNNTVPFCKTLNSCIARLLTCLVCHLFVSWSSCWFDSEAESCAMNSLQTVSQSAQRNFAHACHTQVSSSALYTDFQW